MKTKQELKQAVQSKYGDIASGRSASCCGGKVTTAAAGFLDYRPEQIEGVPEGADLGLGCGNPLDLARPMPGETVLDLGSGAGMDAFLAARAVGPSGRVIGVDMTQEMIDRARANADRSGLAVDFRLGEIEKLPVESASVDAVISNCVINLSPDKPAVFAEAYRVLKPGGRLAVSDIVLERELPVAVRDSVEAYVGCVAGALLRDDYLDLVRAAGFEDVEVVRQSRYAGSSGCAPAGVDEASLAKVLSIGVRARKASRP
jgi:SAM-dependent methyltransferase